MIAAAWLAIVLWAANGSAYEVKAIPTPPSNTLSVAKSAVLMH